MMPEFFLNKRERFLNNIPFITTGAEKEMVYRLARGGIVTFANDTTLAPESKGKSVLFLGKPKKFSVFPFKTAIRFNVPIFYYNVIKLERKGYFFKVHKLEFTNTDQGIENYRRRLASYNPYGFLFTFAENQKRSCNRTFKVNIDGYVSYCPFSVWGIAQIKQTDTDEEITQKLLKKSEEWNELNRLTRGFCPLHNNTAGYINFFQTHGINFSKPAGILDTHSKVYDQYAEIKKLSDANL